LEMDTSTMRVPLWQYEAISSAGKLCEGRLGLFVLRAPVVGI
jgi:hypothetical protein